MQHGTVVEQCTGYAQEDARVEILWLYGSQAKGTAGPDSDYDFAVAFCNSPSDPWQRRLQPELLAQDWADKLGMHDSQISVVDINNIPIPLAFGIIDTGIVLLSKNGLRQAREENRITSMWELDYLYHRRHYG